MRAGRRKSGRTLRRGRGEEDGWIIERGEEQEEEEWREETRHSGRYGRVNFHLSPLYSVLRLSQERDERARKAVGNQMCLRRNNWGKINNDLI